MVEESGEPASRIPAQVAQDSPGQMAELQDDLSNLPPEQQRGLQSVLSLVMGISGPPSDPTRDRITSEHISQALNHRENESRRFYWTIIWFGTLILAAAVGLIVFFGIRETYEVVTAIIGGLLGFAGGIGVGSRIRRWLQHFIPCPILRAPPSRCPISPTRYRTVSL